MNGPQAPMKVSPRLIAMVFLGGAVGTGLRAGIGEANHPWGVFLANTLGAGLLGLLLETLASQGADEGHRRELRLGLGTGLLGSFTTYSTLAVDALRGTSLPLELAKAISSVALGAVAAALGVWLARCRR